MISNDIFYLSSNDRPHQACQDNVLNPSSVSFCLANPHCRLTPCFPYLATIHALPYQTQQPRHCYLTRLSPTNNRQPSNMAPPSQLQIATSSLQRLVKEEASYHKEMQQQQARIEKLEAKSGKGEEPGEEGNAEFELKQEVSFEAFFFF
jgi:hypothetical protein